MNEDMQRKLMGAAHLSPEARHFLRSVPDEYLTENYRSMKSGLLGETILSERQVRFLAQANVDGSVEVYANEVINEGYIEAVRGYNKALSEAADKGNAAGVQALALRPPVKPSLEPPLNVHMRTPVELQSDIMYAYELPVEFMKLRNRLGRLYPGAIHVVAANNGGGKSLYQEQIGLSLAQRGIGVCDFSVEMPFLHRLFRYIQHLKGYDIGVGKYFDGKLSKEEIRKLVATLPESLFISTPMNITDVLAVAEQLHTARGVNVFMLDFIQALQPLKGQQKYESIAYSAEAIYHFTKRFPTTWIVSSQYNRSGKNSQKADREGNRARPDNADLLGANEIETYAWSIVHITKPDEHSNEREFIIGKNRFGPLGDVKGTFNEQTLTFLT